METMKKSDLDSGQIIRNYGEEQIDTSDEKESIAFAQELMSRQSNKTLNTCTINTQASLDF